VSIGYYYEGFLAIQRAVDLQIMYELGGTSAMQALNNTEVQLKSFPYPPYNKDPFIVIIQTQLPFMIMLSFIVTAPVICKDIVLEKEKKLKVIVPSGMLQSSNASGSYYLISRVGFVFVSVLCDVL